MATEDLTHADSRLWRTLAALLFRPGYLTGQFLSGHRAGYLPPVRLYLVLSVMFFLWAGIGDSKLEVLTVDSSHSVRHFEFTPQGEGAGTPLSAARPGESDAQRADRLCKGITYEGPWRARLAVVLPRVCRRVVQDNGRALREAYLHNVPRAMFLFLPLLAGVMKLMYWRPRHYYVEHLLLFVHNHAFVFLLLPLAWVIYAPLPVLRPWVQFALWLYIPWYVFRSMRVVYGQGRALTLGKFALLSFAYLVSGGLVLALASIYSVLTL